MPGLRERQALLAIASVPHLGPVAMNRVLAEFGRRGRLRGFFDLPAEELGRRFRLRPAAVEAVVERGERLLADAAVLERELRERDVFWLLATDADFPGRLRQAPWSPPPILFVRGNEDLLDLPAIAFLNSSTAPPRALEITDALADRVAARGVAVVCGHNSPAYKAAAVAPVRHGSPRLLVLDRGLISAPEDSLEREPVAAARVWSPDWDSLAGLAVSPFRPQDGWARANSRRRDELVAALATGLAAIHVRPGGIMDGILHAAVAGGMWVGVWEDGEAAGNAALLTPERSKAQSLRPAQGLDGIAARLVEAATQGAGGGGTAQRAGRRWAERERHFLYSLLELAGGRTLDADHFLDFGDLDRWPPAPPRPASAGVAVRDATGVRDARPALAAALEALAAGGWLAAIVDARSLSDEDGAPLRQWLVEQGWVAAALALPPREGGAERTALLFRKASASQQAVLTVTPQAPVRDADAHRRYLAQARASVRACLTRSG